MFRKIALAAFVAMFAVPAFGQNPTIVLQPGEVLVVVSGAQVVASSTAEASVVGAMVQVQNDTQIVTVEQIVQAIQSSDIRQARKRRLIRRVERSPRIQRIAIERVTAEALDAGVISVDINDSGDVTTLVDFDALIEFIERIIPLIIQLIGLFGSDASVSTVSGIAMADPIGNVCSLAC